MAIYLSFFDSKGEKVGRVKCADIRVGERTIFIEEQHSPVPSNPQTSIPAAELGSQLRGGQQDFMHFCGRFQ